jgi:hypothetical protein
MSDSTSLEDLVRGNAELMTANTQMTTEAAKLSQLLVESRAKYEDKQERVNTEQVDKLIRANNRLQLVICALVILGAIGAYLLVHRMDAVEASGVVAATEALNANAKADALELKLDDQAEFNETVLQAFEEIKKKWTPSPTKRPR